MRNSFLHCRYGWLALLLLLLAFSYFAEDSAAFVLKAPMFKTTTTPKYTDTNSNVRLYETTTTSKEQQEQEKGSAATDGQDTKKNQQAANKNQQFNASGSFGKMLIQMQKNEEAALLAANESGVVMEEEQVLELDPIPKKKKKTKKDSKRRVGSERRRPAEVIVDEFEEIEEETVSSSSSSDDLPMMDMEAATELDDAVVPVKPITGATAATTKKEWMKDVVKVLPLNPLYTAITKSQQQGTNATATTLLPLSLPEHYLDRIDRDRRHLAVSIAASTEEVAQWRLFCQQQGGIFPILETVREGARAIQHHYNNNNNSKQQEMAASTETKPSSWTAVARSLDPYEEETFHAACSACRAIRDLCAISPELAAVVTDDILRANAAWKGGLMEDFRTILQYASKYTETTAVVAGGGAYSESSSSSPNTTTKKKMGGKKGKRFLIRLRNRRDTRLRCKLYVTQLLLAMVVASDDAVTAIRSTEGLQDAVLACSSYAPKEQRRRWLRYPVEMVKWLWRRKRGEKQSSSSSSVQRPRPPFLEAATPANDLNGQVQRSANQILAALGYNKFVPKIAGQKGLRILSLDGGGSRGMTAVTAVNCLMEAAGNGVDAADSFDLIVGTSTGGIISFLIGLNRETSAEAVIRYQQLIAKIFVKGTLSTPLMLFTTATYDESHFMDILVSILGERSMLDSRADPAVPLVSCLTSKMSSTPTHVALFRNYNYAGGELPDPFTVDPDRAREDLKLPLELENETIQRGNYHRKKASAGAPGRRNFGASRHPGSFRVLQRYALRASTAAPTVFKPVMMGGEMYCDGGIVASNPAAVAIHEARSLFPDIPIELVVSVGTGAFIEQKSAPRVGWDGIIGQIVNSATDAESIHHILEDVLGQPAVLDGTKSAVSETRYFRFNPVIGLPDEFPIDVTDPKKLSQLQKITRDYMSEPEQQEKIQQISEILKGRKRSRRRRSSSRKR